MTTAVSSPVDIFPHGPDTGINETESLLIQLSETFMAAMHNPSNPSYSNFLKQHMSLGWTMSSLSPAECAFPKVQSREDHLRNVKLIRTAYPDWNMHMYNFTASVNVDVAGLGKEGMVFFTSTNSGGPEDWQNRQEMVSRLFWRRRKRDGLWICHRHDGLRGGGMFDS